jgi:hypothetical protein
LISLIGVFYGLGFGLQEEAYKKMLGVAIGGSLWEAQTDVLQKTGKKEDGKKGTARIILMIIIIIRAVPFSRFAGKPGCDDSLNDAIFGAIYYHMLLRSGPLTRRFGEELVEQVLSGHRMGPGRRSD